MYGKIGYEHRKQETKKARKIACENMHKTHKSFLGYL